MSTQTVELLSPDAMKWLQHLEVMQLIRLPKAASKQKTPKKTGISELYGTLNWGVTIEHNLKASETNGNAIFNRAESLTVRGEN